MREVNLHIDDEHVMQVRDLRGQVIAQSRRKRFRSSTTQARFASASPAEPSISLDPVSRRCSIVRLRVQGLAAPKHSRVASKAGPS